MRIVLLVVLCLSSLVVAHAQDAQTTPVPLDALPRILGFEDQGAGDVPAGWHVNVPGTVFVDRNVVHGGAVAMRLERKADSPNEFSAVSIFVEMDFAGKSVELRGAMRTQEVSGFAGLWLRQDVDGKSVAFDNMGKREINGTSDWTMYSVKLPLHGEAQRLVLGGLIVGAGKVWIDDLELLVDGKPVWQAPKKPGPIVETDHEFDAGSRVALHSLTPGQIENLTTLGKVWGFLKYHHPAVRAGKFHWDYELFRVLPSIIDAQDRRGANERMAEWIDKLGQVPRCERCARLRENNLQMRPNLAWIGDQRRLGRRLAATLQAIYANRPDADRQFFLSLAPGIGNPVFRHEPRYASPTLPDAGYRLLALYRFWNVVEYWSPYRDVIGEDWDAVLAAFIPRLALAATVEEYRRQSAAAVARLNDGHAGLQTVPPVWPPAGSCQTSLAVRFVEGKAVVVGTGANEGVEVGDEISEIDGVSVAQLVAQWRPYYSASNDVSRMRDIARFITRGECGRAKLRVRRDADDQSVALERSAAVSGDHAYHDMPGETFRLLSSDIAYLKLSSAKIADARRYIEGAAGAKGLIIDIRNYPSEPVVAALGAHLVRSETTFARVTTGDLANPGAFHWNEPVSLRPEAPRFDGKVVIVVDEVSQSNAEFTAMAFRTVPGAVVVGSQTAGADGDVSTIHLPGGLSTWISGVGVFYPDKRPTQRIGIIPDVEAKPTIAGVRAGRDEVLEVAIRQIVDDELSDAQIERLARHGTR